MSRCDRWVRRASFSGLTGIGGAGIDGLLGCEFVCDDGVMIESGMSNGESRRLGGGGGGAGEGGGGFC